MHLPLNVMDAVSLSKFPLDKRRTRSGLPLRLFLILSA
jgi:hypothetical protein